MICCEKCFCDEEVISIIQNLGEDGNCTICGSKNIKIYDTNSHDELAIIFEELIGIYTPIELLPKDFPKAETRLLKNELLKNWRIFRNRTESDVYKIITGICTEKYAYSPELFDNSVALQELYIETELQKHSLLKTNSWDDFVQALKTKNRFHTHFLNLELLQKFCSYIRKTYKAGSVFYRCRISTEEGYDKNSMSAPPSAKASEGRANALGISCLYLGDSIETTIHEVRAGAFDYVCIGTFRLKEDIRVVDLKRIDRISPFIVELDCKEHAINKEALNKINSEMGKALRRSDSTLDYVPTQYVADFIKSIEYEGVPEYEGIEYQSVMYKGGYNLAIFNPELFECVEIKTYKIDDLVYTKHDVLEENGRY